MITTIIYLYNNMTQIVSELKNKLVDNIIYSKEDLINIIKHIHILKKNDIQQNLYIKIRIKELKQENIHINVEDMYEIALNDYKKKSI